MPTLAEIQSQIESLPHRYIFFTGKEIRALPQILAEGERVCGLTSGIMNNHTWLAVVTQTRVIFLDRGMFYGLRQMQIPLNRIQGIDNENGLMFGLIRVFDGANYFTLERVLKSSIAPFVQAVQHYMEAQRIPKPAPAPAAKPAMDIASQLEHLAALREKGVLTAEEFEAQKKKLLE